MQINIHISSLPIIAKLVYTANFYKLMVVSYKIIASIKLGTICKKYSFHAGFMESTYSNEVKEYASQIESCSLWASI